jgi:hypothetical protein
VQKFLGGEEHGHCDLESWDYRRLDESEEESKRDEGSIALGDTMQEYDHGPTEDGTRDVGAES